MSEKVVAPTENYPPNYQNMEMYNFLIIDLQQHQKTIIYSQLGEENQITNSKL